MSSTKCCPECGQKIRKLNAHRMCKSKVAMLELLAKADDWVFVQEGYGAYIGDSATRAPYRARAHASRLVWFGLAEHGAARSGLYRITEQGKLFLRGEHAVPKVIWCKDGIVVEESVTSVLIGEVRGVTLDKPYWDAYWKEQKVAA